MDRRNRWKLADQLTVYQIGLLMAGYDPAEFSGQTPWENEVNLETEAYISSIKNAAVSGKIKSKIVEYSDYNAASIDWNETLIEIESLISWLSLKQISDCFFIVESSATGLVDPLHPQYAPKLAAAVRAWNEVTSDTNLTSSKTPKQALEKWLRQHANEYGLTKDDGSPNEQGIEEICKVANWKPNGGASPTPAPSRQPPPAPSLKRRPVRPKPPTPSMADLIDDDIPF